MGTAEAAAVGDVVDAVVAVDALVAEESDVDGTERAVDVAVRKTHVIKAMDVAVRKTDIMERPADGLESEDQIPLTQLRSGRGRWPGKTAREMLLQQPRNMDARGEAPGMLP